VDYKSANFVISIVNSESLSPLKLDVRSVIYSLLKGPSSILENIVLERMGIKLK
jgi:hypothetical protein